MATAERDGRVQDPNEPRDLPAPVADTAWRAQQRLHRRYWALSQRGLPVGKVVTAVARELAGFVWDISMKVENELQHAA